jgi:hypothetical protein
VDPALRATAEQLQDVRSAAPTLSALHRQILGLFLSRLELIESQMEILNKSIATGLHCYHEAVQRLAEVPGFGVDSAHQVNPHFSHWISGSWKIGRSAERPRWRTRVI